MKTKRNDICACGSGKKYKKCCLQTDAALTGQRILDDVQKLLPLIEDFGLQLYGSSIESAAWQNFSRWGLAAVALNEKAYQEAFSAWYLFCWLPEDSERLEPKLKVSPSDHALAFDYLSKHRDQLSAIEQRIIEVATRSPYSFYAVVDVPASGSVKLQEIYTRQTLTVEIAAHDSYSTGDVLFTSVLSVNGLCVLLGCMPKLLDSGMREKVESHREKWQAEEGKAIDRRLLYLHDTELRRFYFLMLGKAQKTLLH